MTRYFGAPARPQNLVGLINAATNTSYNYVIGPISSSDGGATWTAGAGSVIGTGTGWRSTYIKDPMLLHDGSQFVAYACGWNSSNFQVGRFTASAYNGTWTAYGSNPILGVPNDGGYRQSGATFPFVIFDNADTPKWRMWVTGSNAGVFTIGYLSSSDGLTWTDHGRVLDLGTAGDQDDTWLICPSAIKIGSTWHVYYAGYRVATGFMKSMHATCTDPADAGTYTKTGVLSGFSGDFTLGGKTWRSNTIRQFLPGPGYTYRVLAGVWNPSVGGEEACFTTTATDPVTIAAPSGLMIALGSGWDANSAENPTAIPAP